MQSVWRSLNGVRNHLASSKIMQFGSSNVCTENKLLVPRELILSGCGKFQCDVAKSNPLLRYMTTLGYAETSSGQVSAAAFPDVDQPQRIKFKRLDKTAKHIMNILDKEAVEKVQAEREIPDIRLAISSS